jgi:hypothetical protein
MWDMVAGRKHVFSAEDDALIIDQSRGVLALSLHKLCVMIDASVQAVERRAKELGVTPRKHLSWSRAARLQKQDAEREHYRALAERDDEPQVSASEPAPIRVPNADPLLARLKQYHG